VNPNLLMLLSFGAAASMVAGAYSVASDLYLRDRSRVSRRVDEEFRRRQRDRVKRTILFKDVNQLALEVALNQEDEPSLRQRFEAMIEQSGLDLTPRKLLTVALAAGLGLGAILGLLRQSVLTGLVGAAVGAVVPVAVVQGKRKARLEKLLSQLPDAFDLMGRVIRAGQTMAQALQAVSDEFAQPIAGEFSYCYEQQNLGLSPEFTMRDLARRTGLLEIKIFVTAMLVQQQTGGNLAELLDKLSAIIRQRYRIRGQIRSLTAEGRMQAAVLLALPIILFFAMLVINRDYASVLLQHPSLIVTTLVLEVIGAVWIRQIVNFDF
jgi:tight adherence protein B